MRAKSCAPIMIRLAWHDSGSYSGQSGWPCAGGATGSIRFSPELDHGANAGLVNAVALLEPIHSKYPQVSWADFIQMASAVAIEVRAELAERWSKHRSGGRRPVRGGGLRWQPPLLPACGPATCGPAAPAPLPARSAAARQQPGSSQAHEPAAAAPPRRWRAARRSRSGTGAGRRPTPPAAPRRATCPVSEPGATGPCPQQTSTLLAPRPPALLQRPAARRRQPAPPCNCRRRCTVPRRRRQPGRAPAQRLLPHGLQRPGEQRAAAAARCLLGRRH
jgi:hypothetical protein